MKESPLILVVDDEPFNVDYLEQELEDLGYLTESAFNGFEALETVTKNEPDVILLDIMMPEMDGFEVLSRLKSSQDTRDIPVIIISALDDMASVVRGIELGAEDYLPKPFDPVLLHARISASVDKKRWRNKERAYLVQIEEEKRRADELLHVILPDPIISELKTTNRVRPRNFDNVAVLFSDVVGFTPYTETHGPEDVVDNLQYLFVAYEDLALRYGLQKIKTIGDSFMAAAGLFDQISNPVLPCVSCGQEMIDIARNLPSKWAIRVGIHVGPVVGGIVGQRQYLFDVWGDTVNTAQRIESHGKTNMVNLSRAAWQMVEPYCDGNSLGNVNVKGKGALEIFCTDGRRTNGL
jgi:adenylate cyclase